MDLHDFETIHPTRMARVYIAGPIKMGDRAENIRRGIEAGNRLHGAGFAVFIPHLNELWHRQHPHTWEEWLAHDLEWVTQCDALLRLSGESKGADLEAMFAQARGLPVFATVEEVIACLPATLPLASFAEYQRGAARTGGSDLRPENRDKGLGCAGLGLAGESGEVCDLLKKVLHHRAPLDEVKLKKELGDVLWYAAHLCNVMGWRLDDVAALNIAKLRARYPNGFTTADSLSRRDEEPPRVG